MVGGEARADAGSVANVSAISVVIPTHNRADALSRLLTALARQTLPPSKFEVIVVADGCRDDSVARLRAVAWPFQLTILEQRPSGAAVARNRGAERAAGEILLFLDDDVEPEPDLLRAHVAIHAEDATLVGLGTLRPVVVQNGFFGIALRGWWEEMSEPVRELGHRYSCFDLLSGHVSIRRSNFNALGGFDSTLRCREDYEFGYRANAAGLTFRLVTAAGASHHETTDLSKAMYRKRDEGLADVQLSERHPALAHALPLARKPEGSSLTTLLYWFAWHQRAIGDAIAWCVANMLPLYELLRLRFRWRVRVEDLLTYWYWRGVATATGRHDRLAVLLAAKPPLHGPCVIDLECGLDLAEEQLETLRPASVRLVYGKHIVGELPEAPGAESLRAIHLRRIIARQFANEYLRAAFLSSAVPEVLLNPALEQALAAVSPGKPLL
jgi:GT2 family glycosyltransferase